MITVTSPFGIKEVGGYCFATIGDVIDNSVSQKGPSKDFVYLDIGSIDRESKRFLEHKLVSIGDAPSRAKQVVATGDVLVSMTRPKLNAVAMIEDASNETIASTGFHVLRAHEMDSKFLYYLVQTEEFVRSMCNLVQGALYPAVRPRDILSFKFQLPPRTEQSRIVEKLEELLSDLDEGVTELRKAQSKLISYRQSLLKSAVEGPLTTDWRVANGKPKETGAELLQRILSKRRAHWEKKQLAKFKERGKAPPRNWQAKYVEPVRPDPDKLPTLPENWAWASLDQLLSQLRSGSAETSIREVTPFPILKSSAVRQGAIDFSALNYVTKQQSREENFLAQDDLLITRLSGSVEYVGCCVTIDHLPDEAVQYPDRIFCGKMTPGFERLGAYIAYWLRSPTARARIEAAAKSTAGHKRISMSDLQSFPIPLPPLDELYVITCRVKNLIDERATLDASVTNALLQAVAQRKNLLKAAFGGQLVPQDPNDEPASELLARIRAARDSKAGGSIASKRGRNPKVAP